MKTKLGISTRITFPYCDASLFFISFFIRSLVNLHFDWRRMMDLRVFWTVAATWWNQPLFDIPRRQLLNQFAPPGTPAAITTITKAAHGAWWLKGALLPVGAAVRQLARNLLRDPAAAAHVIASHLPQAAPAAAAHLLVN